MGLPRNIREPFFPQTRPALPLMSYDTNVEELRQCWETYLASVVWRAEIFTYKGPGSLLWVLGPRSHHFQTCSEKERHLFLLP